MKELMIDELFAGAWVCTQTSPMKVYGVMADGDVILDDGSGNPVKSCIGEVSGLRIDEKILESFGFVRSRKDKDVWVLYAGGFKLTCSLRWKYGVQECRRCSFVGCASNWNEDIRCMHELQRWWIDKVAIPYGVSLELKLKDYDGTR